MARIMHECKKLNDRSKKERLATNRRGNDAAARCIGTVGELACFNNDTEVTPRL